MRNNHLLCKGGGSCISEGAGNSVIITVNTCDTALSNETEIIKAFSPHNDGVNDYLFLSEVEAGILNTVPIDTPWGNVIKIFSDYDNENVAWDGIDKFRKTVGSDTYFYIFESANVQKSNRVNVIK
jgi:hypothetical protein